MPLWVWFVVVAAVAFCLGFNVGVSAMADVIGLASRDRESMDRLMREVE